MSIKKARTTAPAAAPANQTVEPLTKPLGILFALSDEDVPALKKLLDIAQSGVPDRGIYNLANKIRKQVK